MEKNSKLSRLNNKRKIFSWIFVCDRIGLAEGNKRDPFIKNET